MRSLQRLGPSLVVLTTALVVLFLGPTLINRLQHAQQVQQVQLARQRLTETTILREMNDAIRAIAEAVEPSVVHIMVQRRGSNSAVLLAQQSSGSGWVYNDAGYIVTNEHVVHDAEWIEVHFQDGTVEPAELVGADELTDIAVIRVTSRPVIAAVRADGHPLSQGDMVFAFGSPFGFKFSMSSGIVSGQGRQTSPNFGGYENYIQTDAAINPGNSGGPLTNVLGEVVGMNTAIAVQPGAPTGQQANSGVGLAIPLELIEFVVDQIIETGRVRNGGLGVEIARVRLSDFGIDNGREHGILITDAPQGPANRAGLRAGDVIIAVDGEPVDTLTGFRTLVHAYPPGANVVLTVVRGGSEFQTAVELAEWDRTGGRLASVESTREQVESARFDDLGLTVTALSEPLRKMFSIDGNAGAYVQLVDVDSAAWVAGLRPGMIIVEAEGRSIAGVQAFASAIERADRGVELTAIDMSGRRTGVWLPAKP